MALKDLLVHIDDSAQSAARLESAIELATAHEAHLTGLYAMAEPHIPGYIRAAIPEEVMVRQKVAADDTASAAEARFNDAVARAGVSGEWRRVHGSPLQALSLHARYADVAVVGQRDPDGGDVPADPELPDRLVLSLGRPVLVVPKIGSYPVVGERVMVAWDASRLATRAVADAMPFLVRAKRVSVMAVNPEGGPDGHGEIPGADIGLHLARHGVKAEAEHIVADDMDVGAMLLSRAADEGIDLMVMGAYGHARWREIVLGGVTRHMLRHMTMPVLMSH